MIRNARARVWPCVLLWLNSYRPDPVRASLSDLDHVELVRVDALGRGPE
jgi:hypothetical protein